MQKYQEIPTWKVTQGIVENRNNMSINCTMNLLKIENWEQPWNKKNGIVRRHHTFLDIKKATNRNNEVTIRYV